MNTCMIGYDIYVKKCEKYGVKPIELRIFLKQLTQQQLQVLMKGEGRVQ